MSLVALLFSIQAALPGALQGEWRTGCSDGKLETIPLELPVKRVRISESFYGTRTSIEYLFYTDDECTIPQAKYLWQGVFEEQENQLQTQYDRALLIPLSVEAADELNLLGTYCGGAEWRVGDLRDVTACDHKMVKRVFRTEVTILGKDELRFKNDGAEILMKRSVSSE